MDPFEEKPIPAEEQLRALRDLYPRPYDKRTADPYTKARVILMNGTEFEANWFSHSLARRITDGDLRRELALSRDVEKQQQISLSLLKPADESPLEHTISYEQLAVDLTSRLAEREPDCYAKKALDFALLEDFDHLYRYADLLDLEAGIKAERLVGGYTEIMPGRPTIAHHRHPVDNVRGSIDARTADKRTVLGAMTITAAEQQTMNYYMNITTFGCTELSRRLYEEIALVEEEHVTQYESLLDGSLSDLEMLLWHEYNECYLYWSCMQTEPDEYIRKLYERSLMAEIGHLHSAVDLLERYEGKDRRQVIPDGAFPEPLVLGENIAYVRDVLASTVQFTSVKEDYARVEDLPPDSRFYAFRKMFLPAPEHEPAHCVIGKHISAAGTDYRFQTAPSPIPQLRCRECDNISVGAMPGAAVSSDFRCNS